MYSCEHRGRIDKVSQESRSDCPDWIGLIHLPLLGEQRLKRQNGPADSLHMALSNLPRDEPASSKSNREGSNRSKGSTIDDPPTGKLRTAQGEKRRDQPTLCRGVESEREWRDYPMGILSTLIEVVAILHQITVTTEDHWVSSHQALSGVCVHALSRKPRVASERHEERMVVTEEERLSKTTYGKRTKNSVESGGKQVAQRRGTHEYQVQNCDCGNVQDRNA
ncbi:hypothetical protein C8Q79DRAFT_924281 [Trametes meyenii]|nr:hypothetical protein C8Q79DRAFT_924281 [Trametes meyenii]